MNLIKNVFLLTIIVLSQCSSSFSQVDPILQLAKWKLNYTNYETELWSKGYNTTFMAMIYEKHLQFLDVETSEFDYPFLVNETFVNNLHNINATWHLYHDYVHLGFYDSINKTVFTHLVKIESPLNQNETNIYLEFYKNESLKCQNVSESNKLPAYQQLELFFREIIVLSIKSHILTQLSYLTLAQHNFTKMEIEARHERSQFLENYQVFVEKTAQIVEEMKGEIWNCDDYTLKDSYTELTNFVQGYIDNEINMSPFGDCSWSCQDYKSTLSYECHEDTMCDKNYLDKNKTRCDGTIRDCDFLESSLDVCPNENDAILNRRYNYVLLHSGRMLGPEEYYCPEKPHLESWLQSWYQIFSVCSYCFCYCDSTGPLTDRYFSLREVVSNVKENMVVSGVKMIKKNRIIHLQITEKPLLNTDQLNTTYSSDWIGNDNFTMTDVNIAQGIDYHLIPWDNRRIHLDTITGARDELVTGVRFGLNEGSIQLQVRFTSYDEVTGKLLNEHKWKKIDNLVREPILLDDHEISTKQKDQSVQRTSKQPNGNYIVFSSTSLIRDVAQRTIPFLETLPVGTNNAVPLSGVELYYKSQPGYGGYIGVKLITHDFIKLPQRIRMALSFSN